jgi:lipopolysaccharide transport system permease protein
MIAVGHDRASMLDQVLRLRQYRELLFNLTARDIKLRYKQSLFGIAWAVLQPFALMVVFSLIFSRFVHVKTPGNIPYAVFSYVALVPWTYFSRALGNGVMSLIANINLVGKIYFPREIFPLATLLASFVDFVVSAVIFVGLLLYYHIGLTTQALWLPVIVLLQMAFMLGLMLFLSAANVFYRDIYQLLPFLLQVWMYLTPVIYPLDSVPHRYRLLFELDPMTGIIDSFRQVMVVGQPPDYGLLAYTAVVSLILLILGYRFFKRVEMQFADVI